MDFSSIHAEIHGIQARQPPDCRECLVLSNPKASVPKLSVNPSPIPLDWRNSIMHTAGHSPSRIPITVPIFALVPAETMISFTVPSAGAVT